MRKIPCKCLQKRNKLVYFMTVFFSKAGRMNETWKPHRTV